MAATLNQRLASGELTVVEQGRRDVTTASSGFTWRGEYRILSDGRRQWRPVRHDGRASPFWEWRERTY
jgi:hypothetical protein